jgi:hypothetical protein
MLKHKKMLSNREIRAEQWGLLDTSLVQYFFKGSKTILHKPTANSAINIFYLKKCVLTIIYNFFNKDLSVQQSLKTRICL